MPFPIRKMCNKEIKLDLRIGNCLDVLKQLPDNHYHTCVTSPPYWGLRDYGTSCQLGLEDTPEEYVANLVQVFKEVKRVLRDDGTVWLNLGDSYARTGGDSSTQGRHWDGRKNNPNTGHNRYAKDIGLKQKDLIGIPWRVALALQEDGWYLRQDIIWHKPNPMPESVKDRCTKSHEYIFLLSKKPHYYFDSEAISEEANYKGVDGGGSTNRYEQNNFGADNRQHDKRNKRSVWSVCPSSYKEAHFAVFPEELITPCVLSGSPEYGNVLDPFGGSGTVGIACKRHKRNVTLIELNPDYEKFIRSRYKEPVQDLLI
jgi:DNA modification methylase